MQRRFRLTRSTDFKRVRRFGKSYAHPLVVLIVQPNQGDQLRIGVTAGKSIKRAVRRNRAKRLLRAAMQRLLPDLPSGYDLLLIARQPLPQATFADTLLALQTLLHRAGLYTPHAA